jgi:hypothetical protein
LEIVLGRGADVVKIGPVGFEVGVLMTYQWVDLLCKEACGLMLQPLHHHTLNVFT